jgi:hypothetical protein
MRLMASVCIHVYMYVCMYLVTYQSRAIHASHTCTFIHDTHMRLFTFGFQHKTRTGFSQTSKKIRTNTQAICVSHSIEHHAQGYSVQCACIGCIFVRFFEAWSFGHHACASMQQLLVLRTPAVERQIHFAICIFLSTNLSICLSDFLSIPPTVHVPISVSAPIRHHDYGTTEYSEKYHTAGLNQHLFSTCMYHIHLPISDSRSISLLFSTCMYHIEHIHLPISDSRSRSRLTLTLMVRAHMRCTHTYIIHAYIHTCIYAYLPVCMYHIHLPVYLTLNVRTPTHMAQAQRSHAHAHGSGSYVLHRYIPTHAYIHTCINAYRWLRLECVAHIHTYLHTHAYIHTRTVGMNVSHI